MRVVQFLPLFLGLLGFSSQQVFACTGALVAGCEFCSANPAACGLYNTSDINNAKAAGRNECINDSKCKPAQSTSEDGQKICKDNPTTCGLYNQKDVDDAKTAGKKGCIDDPTCKPTVSDPNVITENGKSQGKLECLGNLNGCFAGGVLSGADQLTAAKSDGKNDGKAECLSNLSGCSAVGATKTGAQLLAAEVAKKECPVTNVASCATSTQSSTGITENSVKLACLKDLQNCSATTADAKSEITGKQLIEDTQQIWLNSSFNFKENIGDVMLFKPITVTDYSTLGSYSKVIMRLTGKYVSYNDDGKEYPELLLLSYVKDGIAATTGRAIKKTTPP